MILFALSSTPIDITSLVARTESPAAGGFVAFEGRVRNHNDGRQVASLEYEAYEALAVKEGERILEEARGRYAVEQIAAVHRTGHLEIGAVAVWIGVSAAHRDAAFQACRYVIDEVKRRVPIWKREHYVDGTADWTNCAGCAEVASDAGG